MPIRVQKETRENGKTFNEARSESFQNCLKKHILRLREPKEFQAK